VVGIANVSHNEGELLSDQGRLDEAEPFFREARRVWRAAHYPIGVAASTAGLGRALCRAGRFDEGRALLFEARESFVAIDAPGWVVEAEARITESYGLAGDWKHCRQRADVQLAAPDITDNGPAHAFFLRMRGAARARLGELDEGLADLRHSVEVATASGAVYEIALAWWELGAVASGQEATDATATARQMLADLGVVAVERVTLP
jgi:tetratricopeptide (TPR) repeat protein